MSQFVELEGYLHRVPGIEHGIGKGKSSDGNWWVKFSIDIEHPLAWHVVRLSTALLERRPTRNSFRG